MNTAEKFSLDQQKGKSLENMLEILCPMKSV